MKLSAAIMAHPDRAPLVEELQARLNPDGSAPIPVAWDDEGKPSGKGDRVWRTARRAWLMRDPDADFHVLIQDDAIVCLDLLAGLGKAVDHVPGQSLVCAYLGKGRNVPIRWTRMAERADQAEASWVRSQKLMWGVCLAVSTDLVDEMVAWCDRKAGMPDDMRVGRWFERRDAEVWYTWPSLVDHASVPSLTKHRAVDRAAVRHHQGSALQLDWSGPVVSDPMLIRNRGPRSGPRGAWKTVR